MAAKLTTLTQKIATQLHLVAESCTICSSRSRRPVRKLLDTPSYVVATYFTTDGNQKTTLQLDILSFLIWFLFSDFCVEHL
jgi:hypothetical protein